jgi:serine/threonine protein kinase
MGMCTQAYQSTSGRLYLVFEHVEYTLLHLIKASSGGLAPAQIKSATWQLLKALAYMHRKKVGFARGPWVGGSVHEEQGVCAHTCPHLHLHTPHQTQIIHRDR